tara:strand:+ start:4293 stop:4613 length:321 start_codon:yes stop_codon:yes gene_type:complete
MYFSVFNIVLASILSIVISMFVTHDNNSVDKAVKSNRHSKLAFKEIKSLSSKDQHYYRRKQYTKMEALKAYLGLGFESLFVASRWRDAALWFLGILLVLQFGGRED